MLMQFAHDQCAAGTTFLFHLADTGQHANNAYKHHVYVDVQNVQYDVHVESQHC
jgi:hypothetical protein